MNPNRGIVFAFLAFLTGAALFQAASAQTCPDTNPEADSQLGCPDPFYAEASRPIIGRNAIEFNITVKNRRIAFPPDCAPGECYENANYQSLPLCDAKGWSGRFTGVKAELASCYPGCGFNISITPPGLQDIENGKSQNFTVRIEAYSTEGEYDLTFRALLFSVKKKVFSMRLNISSQPSGIEGDNAACSACASEKCDMEPTTCGYACAGTVYCKAPGCSFDTPFPEAAESCCGDDSGEALRQCSKTGGIEWDCPLQTSCCERKESCAYGGNCYEEGKAYLLEKGEDEYAYCSSGTWHGCDESADACSKCGFLWNSSGCCGDDAEEYYRSRICLSGCETNMTDRTCCAMGSACVYSGGCYATGDVIILGGKNVTCEGGAWSEKTPNQSACYKGECSKKDSCEGPCPGCMFKDFSCYGTNCEADYIDPDMHWTYCESCSSNWSDSGECCGDDEKEHWVPPCPNVSVSWKCCSNPNERVNARGECVISCGVGVAANVTGIDESLVPLSVSLSPEVVDVEAGKAAEIRVLLRTDGSHSLHNIVLNLCGPFSFEVSPKAIEELRPGEEKNFTVRLVTAPDSALGTWNFAAYVSSSELIRQRYKPGLVNVNAAGYPSYDLFLWAAGALAAVYIAKKFLSRRREKPASGKGAAGARTPEKRPGKGRNAALGKLAELVGEELEKGTPRREIREMLASSGIRRSDVEAAFRKAGEKGRQPRKEV